MTDRSLLKLRDSRKAEIAELRAKLDNLDAIYEQAIADAKRANQEADELRCHLETQSAKLAAAEADRDKISKEHGVISAHYVDTLRVLAAVETRTEKALAGALDEVFGAAPCPGCTTYVCAKDIMDKFMATLAQEQPE